MGRNRTLLGTKPVFLRLSTSLIQALDEWARREGVSRNVLVGRELAKLVLMLEEERRVQPAERAPSGRSSRLPPRQETGQKV